MLRAFTFMVDRQIEHQARSEAPRRRRARRRPRRSRRCAPTSAEPARLVLADCGASSGWPAGAGAAEPASELVHLVACRASGERFEAFLRPRRPLGPSVSHQLEVPEAHLRGGEDPGAALSRFRAFVGDRGVLGTWGSFTAELLAGGLRAPAERRSARPLRAAPRAAARRHRQRGAGPPGRRADGAGHGRAGRNVGWLEVVLARLLYLAEEDSAPDS